jgi:hypothetical protein
VERALLCVGASLALLPLLSLVSLLSLSIPAHGGLLVRKARVAVLSSAVVFASWTAACGSDSGTPGSPALAPPDPPAVDAGSSSTDGAANVDAQTQDAGALDAASDASASGVPPFPQLVSSGGPTLAHPKVVPIFYPGYAWTAQVTDWLTKVGATPYWSAATAEYGVGPLVMGTPVNLTETAPTATDSNTISTWLAGKLDGTHPEFGTADPQTIYAVFFPKTTQIDGATGSCTSYGGYHEDLTVGANAIPYAVIPECPTFGPVAGLDMVTGAGSHELIEAATDPYPSSNAAYSGLDDASLPLEIFLGGNAENGDLCSLNWDSFFKPAGFDYVVQRGWSNVAAKAGKEPCAPSNPKDEPYFAAAPVMPDTATVLGVSAKTVKIAVGDTKTIDVMLWSNAPTSKPWTVQVKQPKRVTTPQLELTLDKSSGQNGDTLKLTVKVLVAGKKNYESFAIESNIGNQRAYWAGVVTQ